MTGIKKVYISVIPPPMCIYLTNTCQKCWQDDLWNEKFKQGCRRVLFHYDFEFRQYKKGMKNTVTAGTESMWIWVQLKYVGNRGKQDWHRLWVNMKYIQTAELNAKFTIETDIHAEIHIASSLISNFWFSACSKSDTEISACRFQNLKIQVFF